MSKPTHEDAIALESLIDRIGMYELLSLLQAICADKAEHLRSAWQENNSAIIWENLGAELCALDGIADILDGVQS